MDVGTRRKQEDVHVGVGTGEFGTEKDAREVRDAQVRPQPFRLGAVVDDFESIAQRALGPESVLNLLWKSQVLLRSEATAMAQHNGPVLESAPLRMKKVGIDATLDQEREASGAFAQQDHEVGSRGQH